MHLLFHQADPSSPNILNVPFIGDDVLAKLRRPFWTELESRFGNMFYVREQVGMNSLPQNNLVYECLISCLAVSSYLGKQHVPAP